MRSSWNADRVDFLITSGIWNMTSIQKLFITGGVSNIKSTIEKKNKHEKFKWISEEDVAEFIKETISDFKDTLSKVFRKWNEFFCEVL